MKKIQSLTLLLVLIMSLVPTGASALTRAWQPDFGDEFAISTYPVTVGFGSSAILIRTDGSIMESYPEQVDFTIWPANMNDAEETHRISRWSSKDVSLANGREYTVTFVELKDEVLFRVDLKDGDDQRYVEFDEKFRAIEDQRIFVEDEYIFTMDWEAHVCVDREDGGECYNQARVHFEPNCEKPDTVCTGMEYPSFNIREGETVNKLGAAIEYLGSSRFIVYEDPDDYPEDQISVSLSPSSQTADRGDKVRYKLTVKDLRPECIACKVRPTPYIIDVDVPFSANYDNEIELMPGEKQSVDIIIYTNVGTPYPYPMAEDEAVVGGGIGAPVQEADAVAVVDASSLKEAPAAATEAREVPIGKYDEDVQEYVDEDIKEIIADSMGVYTVSARVYERGNAGNSDSTKARLYLRDTPRPGNWVEVEITPSYQIAEYGDRVKYEIEVQDLHPRPLCPDTPGGNDACAIAVYSYKLHVGGLPFDIDGDGGTIDVVAGGRAERTIYVNTDERYDEEVAYASDDRGIVSDKAVPVHIGDKFTFYATVKGDDGSYAKDYATLAFSDDADSHDIPINKGWNLVSIPPEQFVKFEDRIASDNRLVAFVWLKAQQEYVTIQEARERMGTKEFKDYISRNGFWVHSRQKTTLGVRTHSFVPLDELDLVNGWNILPTVYNRGANGERMSEIMEDCKVEEIWAWDEDHWDKISLKDRIDSEFRHRGLLVKNRNSCSLGGGDLLPPPMPSGYDCPEGCTCGDDWISCSGSSEDIPEMEDEPIESGADPVPETKACTMEAKICPDGTAVSRTGPDCEFAKCPGE